jgi:hypothetical protein
MSPRVRTLVTTGATILILALVIFGLWAFTAPKNQTATTPPTIKLSPAQESQQAYQDGNKAISNNQTDTAISDYEKAVALDPTNTEAQTALDTAKKSTSASGNNGGSSTTKKPVTPPPAGAWDGKVAVVKVLPTAFTDYDLGKPETGPTTADVSATPKRPGAAATTIVWTVLDQGTNAKADAFVADVTKKLYTKDPAQVAVNDVTAYFGTDGADFASIAFVRGRYVFEVIVTSQSPAGAKEIAQQAATAFPAKP